MKSLNEEIHSFSLFLSKLILFGLNNQLVVTYKEENLMAFKNLFLKSYSGVDEDDYSVAVYNKQSVFDHLYYIMDQVWCFFSLSGASTSHFTASVSFVNYPFFWFTADSYPVVFPYHTTDTNGIVWWLRYGFH